MFFTSNLGGTKPRLVAYGRTVYLPFVITGESEVVATVERVDGGGHGAVIAERRKRKPQHMEAALLAVVVIDEEIL